MGADPNLPEAQIHIQLMTGGQPHGDDLWAPVHIEESATLGALLPSTSDLEGIFAYWASMARPATRGARGGGEWPRGHVGARVVCGPMTTAIDVDDITLAGPREVAVATRCNVWLVCLVDTPQPLLDGAAAHTPSPRPTAAEPGGAPGPQARGRRAGAATAPSALTHSPGQRAAATATPGSPASSTPRAAPGKGRKRRKTRPRPDTSARGSGSGSDDAGRGDTSDAGKDSDYRQAEDEETDTDDTSDAPGSATAEEGDGDDGAPVAVNIVLETRGCARLSQREKHAIDPAAKQMRLEQEPRPLGFVDIRTAIGDNGEATAAACFEATRTEGGLTSFVVHGSLRPEKGDSSLRARRAVTIAALQCGIDKLDRDGRFDDHHGATVMVTVDLGAVPIARNVSRGSRENTQGRCNEHAGGVQDVVERQGLDMKVTVRADGDGPAARWAEVRQTAGPAVAAGAVRGAGATAPTGPAPGSTAGPGNGHAAGAQTATAPVAWMAQCPHDMCKCRSTTAGALYPVRHKACPTTGHLRDSKAPGIFCPVCPGHLQLYPTQAALAAHLRKCPRFTREQGEAPGFRACYPDLNPCGKCAQLHVNVASHERGCKRHTIRDRVAMLGACAAELTPEDVDIVHREFPATYLIEPTRINVNILTHSKFMRVIRELEDAQVTELLALARQHGPEDDHASAALGLTLVTRKLLAIPSPSGAKKLTMGEFNARVAMIETKAWKDIKDALDDAAAPTTSRVPDTAQGHVDAAVKQTQQAIRKGRLGAAHGHLASSAVGIQLKRGYHDHMASGNFGEDNVSTDRRLDDIVTQQFSGEAVRRAAWQTNVGSAPGADGVTRTYLLNMSEAARVCWAELIANGLLPGGRGKYGAVMAGGNPFASSKPGKKDHNVRMLMAQSHICRMVGKLLIEENKEVIKEALGPYQSSFKTPNGPEIVAMNVRLHQERHANPITLKSDLQGAFPNSDRASELDNCIQTAPNLAGYRASLYSESPIISFLEDHNGVLEWVHYYVQGGGVQGDLLEPVTFPMQQAAVRQANNERSVTAHQSDYMDDTINTSVAINGDGTTNFEIADMFRASKDAAAECGGKYSPGKTEVIIPAGLEGDRLARHQELICRLEDINGGRIRVLVADHDEVKEQGMDVLGVPVGTAAYAVHCWKEAFDKKKMRPEVFNRLTTQEQMNMIIFTEQRYNHKCRGDMAVEATREIRQEIDDYYFGPEGIVFTGPLRLDPLSLTPPQRDRLRLRFHMLAAHGGLGLRPLSEDGEFSQLSMVAEVVRSDGALVPNRDWLVEQLKAGATAESPTATFVLDNIKRFAAQATGTADHPAMEGARHKLPLTLEAVLSGRPMTQSAIRATQSLTRKQVWEGLAPASEKRLVKHMQPRDWTAFLTPCQRHDCSPSQPRRSRQRCGSS